LRLIMLWSRTQRQVFSGVIEKYLVAAEKLGGVEPAKEIELVEEAQGEEKRWEEGREGYLRARSTDRVPVVLSQGGSGEIA
jgi:hypothetical protein